MGIIKRLLLISVLFLLWNCIEIKCEGKGETASKLKDEKNNKKSKNPSANLKIENVKLGETKISENVQVENLKREAKAFKSSKIENSKAEEEKSTENKKLEKLKELQENDKKDIGKSKVEKEDLSTTEKLEENKNSPKESFLENDDLNSNTQNSKEDIKETEVSKENIKPKENSKEVEHSIVKEITPKKEEMEVENKRVNVVEQGNDNIPKKDIVSNNENSNSENEYIDLTSKKIYEEINNNNNNHPKGSNLYFLKILSTSSSIFMQLILFPTIFKILKRKSTGELDGLPYLILFYSSFLWLIYGILINNSAIVFPNLVGLLLGILYSLVYHKNCKNMWLKQKLYSYYKICGLISFLLYALLYILSYEQYQTFVGFIASVSSIINFGAPLSYIQVVIKKKNSSLIPLEMTIGSLMCSFLWLTYGFTLRDAFLIIPNLCGFLLSLVQVILIVLYSNKEPLNYVDNEFNYNEGNNKFVPDNIFFNEFNLENEQKVDEVPTSVRESFFDFSYDETSPLTGNYNTNGNKKNVQTENYLNHSESGELSTALNF
ncbi:MtN3-like protein, putative [Plasmodium gallinaceum]|uniref:Sugar transporter SWEET1 n=1 Tax=Plasmodium gallinaceum TaxID=5849 RepID=A0A1J1GPE4_PLAGA|nr:MtN3-like protein, putative [Plasmodium gallinaceum]CRG94369.1 MtN3-like protein, putative [Plasmodium gallinaceum]